MTKSKDFDSSFRVGGTQWNVKITTDIAIEFGGQHNFRLEELVPECLNMKQMIQLVWMGIQHHVEAEGFDYKGWVDSLHGENLTKAIGAGDLALINFTLLRLPEVRRPGLRAKAQKQIDAQAAILKAESGTLNPTAE